ncbi:MAG: spondin domain-containing protein [Pseudomonadota bacterium]
MTTEVRIAVINTSGIGGTAFTPLFAGFHDGSFDVYNPGEAASAGLEAVAEDGANGTIAAELIALDSDGQTVNVVGTTPAGGPGPIEAGGRASTTLEVDGASNGFLSLASMVLPSNDAFFGTNSAVQLFSEKGRFEGAQTLIFEGSDVLDAGTEVNTELDAAFINQTAPNTGVDEGGVVTRHPGFNGSLGNPVGEGDQIILGGTNAFGQAIDPVEADFTQPGAQIAAIHVNTVRRIEGGDRKDFIFGGRDDDIVHGNGGADIILGRGGWDVIYGGDGKDFISGGSGADELYGGKGADVIRGGSGSDLISGGKGKDVIFGGSGDDVISGGAGFDILRGGGGDDRFVFSEGSDVDHVRGFDRNGDDSVVLSFSGVDSFDDILGLAVDVRGGVELDFGSGDVLVLGGIDVADLSQDDFVFV